MLPDVLTEGDNLEMPPMPDASFLFSQMDDEAALPRKRRAGSRDINLQEDFTGSQFLQNSIENTEEEDLNLEVIDDLDLGVDFGLDFDDFNIPKAVDQSVEIGRDAPASRAPEDDLISEMEFQAPAKEIDMEERDTSLNLGFNNDDDQIRMGDDDGDIDMFNGDVSEFPAAPMIRPERISESPLSDIDDHLAQEVEQEHYRNLNSQLLFQPEEEEEEQEETIIAPQRVRKHKYLQPDTTPLSLSNASIKEMQKDRSKVTQTQTSLPRDPVLLSLLEMRKNGGFVSSIMGDGRSAGWAPELRGMLSIDTVRRTGELKRKRDSGIADMDNTDNEQPPSKSPRLDLGEEEDDVAAGLPENKDLDANTTIGPDGTILEMAGNNDDGFMPPMDDEETFNAPLPSSPAGDEHNFDETTAPLVHPADSGPVSLGTKHAVHLLRDKFGAEAANSPNKRKNASVLFQDLLPEATTTRADATKMFFEVLVLATKDAVKVEQAEALLGGPIRVRGKRGLWGDWAEREAGGEIAEEQQEEVMGGPSRLEQSVAIAASA